MRKLLPLLFVALLSVAVPAAAQAAQADPFPAGACVRATFLDPKPVCVVVDPTH